MDFRKHPPPAISSAIGKIVVAGGADLGSNPLAFQVVEGLDAGGGPDAFGAGDAGIERVERVFEERPEPGEEEHHLGHDEQDEAVAQADQQGRQNRPRKRIANVERVVRSQPEACREKQA